MINPRNYGHYHDTVYHPETGELYHPGCPVCEATAKYYMKISMPGITEDEFDRITKEYKDEIRKLRGKNVVDIAIEEVEKQLKGKVVEWTIEHGDTFVFTMSSGAIVKVGFSGHGCVYDDTGEPRLLIFVQLPKVY